VQLQRGARAAASHGHERSKGPRAARGRTRAAAARAAGSARPRRNTTLGSMAHGPAPFGAAPQDALAAVRYLNGTILDERAIRVDIDYGFEEGRQFGRGRSGGQVRAPCGGVAVAPGWAASLAAGGRHPWLPVGGILGCRRAAAG
jgi:hypothetical protein